MAWLTLVGSMVWGRGCLDTVWICLGLKIWFIALALQKTLHLETENSVSNPSRNRIPDGLETEFSVLKTLVCDFDRL